LSEGYTAAVMNWISLKENSSSQLKITKLKLIVNWLIFEFFSLVFFLYKISKKGELAQFYGCSNKNIRIRWLSSINTKSVFLERI